MKLQISFLIGLTVLMFSAVPASAQFYRGGDLGVGVRAMGLGGAFSAISDDASAPYWNPAGLAQLEHPELMGMFGSYFNDKDRNLFLSFHYPLPKDIHVAVSTNNLFYTDISGAHEDQYTGSVAIPLDFITEKRLLFGVNFRFLFADLGEGNGTQHGTGVDLGLLFKQPFQDNTEFKAALVLDDLSTNIHNDSTGVEQGVPSVLTAGFAYHFDPRTQVSLDIPWTVSEDLLLGGQDVRFRAGAEHWFFDGRFGLRAGFVSFVTLPSSFSVGASYRTNEWSIDYAYMDHPEDLGDSHRIGASYLFDAGEPRPPDPKPYMVQSYVGDQKIFLQWDIPEKSQADGYYVYVKTDEDKDFYRARQEILTTKYCLLKGAKNGERYHIIIRSVVDGQEKFSCDEWIAVPEPMSQDAEKYYQEGLDAFHQNLLSQALYLARKAEELDPNNFDIKDLIRRLETTHHEGLAPEEDSNAN